jgi:iron complex outermembrane receptor protein
MQPAMAQEEQEQQQQEQQKDPGETEETTPPAEDKETAERFTEQIVVTGSRAGERSVTESMVPIDVIPSEELTNQGETDLSNLLRTVAPSWNVNSQPISDAATLVRPANLRNLAPDHTLVLVDNKRRHRAAIITWIGNGVADGSQGPDIAQIPAIALRQVEVLRDGASAQYGSDAIAGVLNLLLRNDTSKGSVEARLGKYADGDGDTAYGAANFGVGFGEGGFGNFSVEYGQSDPTSRSVQRDDAAALIAAGNDNVRDPAQIWGLPEVDDDIKLFANFGHPLGGPAGTQLYGHANYGGKKVTGGFYYRNPNTRSGVFSPDDGETLLIGDLLDVADGVIDGSAGCPVVSIVNDVPDPVALAQVFANPNCFSFQEIFPGGFTPQFGGDVTDGSLVLGLNGVIGDKLTWDTSVSGGYSDVEFFIVNTVNASLGPDTPTNFDPGTYTQQDMNFNFDLTYLLGDLTNLAGGVEYRDEEFEIGVGQLESWLIGPLADQGFSAASNGFPGFADIAGGTFDRANYAIYADVERAARNDRFSVGLAVRFEDFEDFGSTTNGKVSSRLKLTDDLSLRGAVQTCFRAPTPGQSNAFNVTTEFDLVKMELVNNGTIPPTSEVALLRGGEPLQPEESENYSIGLVFDRPSFSFTVDAFRVDVSDRLVLSEEFVLTPEEAEQLVLEGITAAASIENFRFFVNDFDTKTEGIDVVASWAPTALDRRTQFNLLFNSTRTDVTKLNPVTLSANRVKQIEQALPETRATLTATHNFSDDFRLLGRVGYWDEWYDNEDGRIYGGETLADIEAAYTFTNAITLVVGAQNVFDQAPEENPNAAAGVGNRYSQYTPFGFNGAFWYGRLKYDFDW